MPVRIYELAHEFDLSTKEVLDAARQAGLSVKSHSSTIEDYEADLVRRHLSGGAEDETDEEPVAATPAAPPAPPPPPVPEVNPDEQLARARSTHVALQIRSRMKPKAAGVKLSVSSQPPAAVAEASEGAVAEAPPPVETVAPVESPEIVVVPPAVEVQAAPPPAVETPAAPPAAPVEAVAAAPVAPAAPAAEAPPAAAASATPAAPTEETRRIIRPVRRPPGPKLAPRPKAGPKLAQKPRPHPQAVKTPAAPPGPHPQAVGVGVTKKKETPARPGRGRPKPAGVTPAPPPPTEEAGAEVKGRRKSTKRGAAEEEAEGIRKAHAFRRRERIRKREDMEEMTPAEHLAAGSMIANERTRVSRTGRTLITRPARPQARPAAEGPKKAVVEFPITVKSLSAALGIKASEIIMKLMGKGVMATINDALTEEQSLEIALERGMELEVQREQGPAEILKGLDTQADAPEALRPRSPVVVFMGHVDHGKTSLMDTIRKTHVAEGEAGGITQHIGAYRVHVGDRWITFLDTPGHAAFTAMRARGARVTDVAVLVVAADDGVMPQTEEAINHAKAAGVPIVVALNKCDLPQANPQRVKQQLIQYGLQPEEWGGKTICIETSAVTGKNVDQLLESLLLEAEMRELRANPERPALGTVIEAQMTEGFGPQATLLVQNGTLKNGNVVVAGTAYGRIRALTDENGHPMKDAGPSVPVRVAGLTSVPQAGDRFYVLKTISMAKTTAEERERRLRETALVESRQPRTLEAVFEQMGRAEIRELPIVLKADVQGSVQALRENLEKITHAEVRVHVIHSAVGGISESDVLLADASNAVIIGFNVATDPEARLLAETRGVDVRLYQIIYDATDDVRKALEGLLTPQKQERRLGECNIVQTFKISRVGTVAGCMVSDGIINRNARIRVIRDGVVIHTGALQSLKRIKDDVREVRAGQDCGLHLQGYDDIKVGDRLEAFETVTVARTLG